MLMHRALYTYFIILIFFIMLCLKLESHKQWNWFFTFFPLWFHDLILLMDALFYLVIHCKHETLRNMPLNKDILVLVVVLLKILAQILLCLKLEYPKLNLEVYHVLIPVWLLFPILIIDVSITLFKSPPSE